MLFSACSIYFLNSTGGWRVKKIFRSLPLIKTLIWGAFHWRSSRWSEVWTTASVQQFPTQGSGPSKGLSAYIWRVCKTIHKRRQLRKQFCLLLIIIISNKSTFLVGYMPFFRIELWHIWWYFSKVLHLLICKIIWKYFFYKENLNLKKQSNFPTSTAISVSVHYLSDLIEQGTVFKLSII